MKYKRLAILLLLIPFLLNGPVLAKEDNFVVTEKIEAKKIEKRAETLQAYLAKYNSPLQYQAQDFIDAADQYDLDWRLVAAISGVESTFGKHVPGGTEKEFTSYNGWGWGVYGTQAIYFKSWREAIFTISKGLRNNYINKGLTDPYAMNRVYAASPVWGEHVAYFLNDMEKFQTQYEGTIAMGKIPNPTLQIAGPSARLILD